MKWAYTVVICSIPTYVPSTFIIINPSLHNQINKAIIKIMMHLARKFFPVLLSMHSGSFSSLYIIFMRARTSSLLQLKNYFLCTASGIIACKKFYAYYDEMLLSQYQQHNKQHQLQSVQLEPASLHFHSPDSMR